MKLLVALEDTGSLKEIECLRGTDTSVQTAKQPISIVNHAVESRATHILKFLVTSDSKYLVAARKGGDIVVYERDTFEEVKRYTNMTANESSNFVSLIQDSTNLIYSCCENGVVSVIDLNTLNHDDNDTQQPTNLQLTGPVSCFVLNPNQTGIFAYGGKENEIKVISITNGKLEQLWESKNVSLDHLRLPVPVWISGINFLNTDSAKGQTGYHLLAISRYGHIRVYKTWLKRRPVKNFQPTTKSLRTLTHTSTNLYAVCSDSAGLVGKFSLKDGKMVGKYHGSVGFVRALYNYRHSVIATGGLDRYVRVYDLDTCRILANVFVTSQVTDIIMLEDGEKLMEEKMIRKEKEREQAVEEAEALWEELENNSSTRKKKKL
ncbi:BA75_02429T0 [Komagataella pastoris]|uniref:Ribosome biogenesis protein NSA1 n=1 Tax=Komagataella pastoris TaxID=4922 RepID=A0A1B2JCK7_PICPA|nr:BA75_02429T0 [Komagataella pastoris]